MNTVLKHQGQTDTSISIDEYSKFCDFFYRKTGIMFTEKKGYFVERRLVDRIEKTAAGSFRAYFSKLRFDPAGEEWQQLVNQLTVNETYFLREDYQFEALVSGLLPEVVRDRKAGATVKIWSMPCSTGEEPYSIAIQILEKWAQSDNFAIEIHASDIDSRVVSSAVEGLFGERSLQRLSPELRKKYFVKTKAGQFQIRDEIRKSIDFTVSNIINPANMARFRNIDVIFCRNLLIYFDDLSRREAVDMMYECLTPGGFICLGHSESMSRISPLFRPRKFGDTIIYQKMPKPD